ncbi:MAG TPA: peptidyl-dipeptidase Dcp [Steroidobacteraceae bacterium]|jgi:peptidyl-dipeptidase Dcp|nr:peptidyl-dipeptidase Dcp [Steroidobacteraceae bacterium]
MRRAPASMAAAAVAASASLLCGARAGAGATDFGPANPFYAPSALPFHAPPFDRIKDEDYQPAIEAGMAQQLAEIERITDEAAPPTFENTLVAFQRSGRLLNRARAAFSAVSQASTNPTLQGAKTALAPKFAAHEDAIHLNQKLFDRMAAIYRQRATLRLDAESLRLVEVVYDEFVHAGANLSDSDKSELKKLNEEASTLSNDFSNKLLEATKNAAFTTAARDALAGLSESQLSAAASAAEKRGSEGFVIPLQNTTQQPLLASLSVRATRDAIFHNSWNRTERGDANDTRADIVRLAQLRAQRAKLLGFPNHAAWKIEDQMAKTPAAALQFMEALVPVAKAKAASEAADIQAVIDARKPGFALQPWDWDFYADQVRKAKFDLDEAEVKPYFELNNVLENGVFYAANRLYGIRFKERKDIPVYHPDVRVFEVTDVDGRPLALFYCDYFKRDNKDGGAWMSFLVRPSKLLVDLAVVYNVANLPKPAPGEPALISFTDVTTMFHEFGHALHGMFANTRYPTLSGTTPARDFVEFPSQFNEHWALYPEVFEHYARHYKTGAPMPETLVEKIKKASNFNEGYKLTELLAAAELDMQWHILPADAPLQDTDEFEKRALARTHLDIAQVPPRYRSSYFNHIWDSGYSAGYYAYLWTQMLDDDAFQWFDDHGGLTRANGQRFRRMILSRGNTQDLGKMYEAWRGKPPGIDAMMKYRGLKP